MKNLMLSAAIAAVILPVTSCAGEGAKSQQAETQKNAADARVSAEAVVEMPAATTSAVKVSYLGATDISAKAFLAEQLFGDNGETIAQVTDILIGADGTAQRIVYNTGGIGGVGVKQSAIAFDMVEVRMDKRADPTTESDLLLRLSMTADQMKNAADFNQIGDDDYRLASEILGSKIDLLSTPGEDDEAVVDDLILSIGGDIKHVIVQHSMIASVAGGDRYAFDFPLLRIEEGDGGGLALDVTEAQFNGANKFEYKRSDAIEEAAETAKDPDDKF